jgi:hypothetical protein
MILAKSYEVQIPGGAAGGGGGGGGKKRAKKKQKMETETFYANAEDEVFGAAAETVWTFRLNQQDGRTDGTKHFRSVMLLSKAQFDGAVTEIVRLLPSAEGAVNSLM